MNRKPGEGVASVPVRRIRGSEISDQTDIVVVEEPLLIRLRWPEGDVAVAVTMRTPGNDRELAIGFLFAEGVIASGADITTVDATVSEEGSQVTVELAHAPIEGSLDQERNFYMTSSCGVCGKASIEAIHTQAEFAAVDDTWQINAEMLVKLPEQMSVKQTLFAGTGSIHAAATFDAAGLRGEVFEDVGRHNAVDKLLGNAFLHHALPARDCGLLVSGRASFELVQKAYMAGCPMLVAVGAPSSLAIELAWEANMTLLGFLRDGRFNVYAGQQRVVDLP